VAFRKPLDARTKGIEIVYQDLALCNNLTVLPTSSWDERSCGRSEPWRGWTIAEWRGGGRAVRRTQVGNAPRDLVRLMSGGQRQAVAIARTRLSDAKVVLMDEPTAAIRYGRSSRCLSYPQAESAGVAVVLISHRMPDVFAVCDRVAVMRRGARSPTKLSDKALPKSDGLITGAIRKLEGSTA